MDGDGSRVKAEDAIERARVLAPGFAAQAPRFDRTAEFPHEHISALRQADLLALTVRQEWGGPGLGIATACRVVEAIAMGEPSTALVLAMQYIHHGTPAGHGHWRRDGHERISRDSVQSGAMINVMRAEPELGTPARGGLPATTACRVEGGWRLSGDKLYATGSPVLAYFVTWAKTDEPEPRVGWFAVPRAERGWRVLETWDHLGMRATGSHDLVMEGAFVPDELVLDVRSPREWAPPDPYTGTWNNLVLAALYSGVAKSARDWLAGYLRERVPSNLGAPLATLPRMQQAVGEIEALLFANDALIHGLADNAESAGFSARLAAESSFAKMTATNNAVRAVEIAIGLVGNPGLARRNPLERHYRDVLCGRIHVPQDDMVQLMAGRAALGLG
jgi:alkylation response protein AidB-like acyl-CoA dehydrogenase